MDQEWYQKFVSEEHVDRDMLFELLTAANFMGIKPLLDLTCLKVTFQLTGKSADEVGAFLTLAMAECFALILIIFVSCLFRSVRFSNFLSSHLRRRHKPAKTTNGFLKTRRRLVIQGDYDGKARMSL
jgi:hypothetical protein